MNVPFLCAAVFSLAIGTTAADLQIQAEKKQGRIIDSLAGISQGGNTGTYFKPQFAAGLRRLAPPLVRIEMITNSRPHRLLTASGDFDWSRLDREIEAIRNAGGEPIINFFGTPTHLASNPKAKIPAFTPPRDFAGYADFCARIVRHVNRDKKYNVRLWEFWNEPSGSYFWTDWRNGNRRFFELWREVFRAVKTVDPEIQLGGFGDNAMYPEHYRSFLKFARQEKVEPDFLSIHYYGDWAVRKREVHPADYGMLADQMRQICRKALARELPLYYTEWNLPAESKGRFSSSQLAAWLAGSLVVMQQDRGVAGAAFFRVEPYRDPAASLLDQSGKLTHLGEIMRFWRDMPDTVLAMSGTNRAVNGIAAGSAEKIAVLLVRYAPGVEPLAEHSRVMISGVRPKTDYRVTRIDFSDKYAPLPPENFRSSAAGTLEITVVQKTFETTGLVISER